jgi:hypothetical protein
MGASHLQQSLHFTRHVPGLASACYTVASLSVLCLSLSVLCFRSFTLQTCWDTTARPPIPVFFAANCEWFLVENEFGDCGWLLISESAVSPDLERICNIGSSTLAAELGASGRAFAAPCSWVRTFPPRKHSMFWQLMLSFQINLLLLKPLLLNADPESTIFPCARPPLNHVRTIAHVMPWNSWHALFFVSCMNRRLIEKMPK